MKHLAFNIGLLLALLFSSQSMLAAVEFESDNIKFTVTNAGDLTCAVSGLTDSGKEMESIQIPETVEFLNKNFTVTAIDRYAFTENKTVKNIALPTSVTSIGEYAFNECSNLSEINLPDNISTIGRYSFAECTSLNEIILPESLTTIDSYVFYKSSIKKFTINEALERICSEAFTFASIQEVYVSSIDKWLSIDFWARSASPIDSNTKLFINNELLEHLVTPEGQEIQSYAFFIYKYLKSAIINGNCSSDAFYGCGLEEITVAPNVTHLCNFQNCSNLSSVTIEDGTEPLTIDYIKTSFPFDSNIYYYSAFSDCKNLQKLYLGRNITLPPTSTVDIRYTTDSHFNGKQNLQEVTIGPYVNSLPYDEFYNCPIKKLIICDSEENLSTNKPTIGYNDSHFIYGYIESLYLGRAISFPRSDISKKFISTMKYLKQINFGSYGDPNSIINTNEATELRDITIDQETPPTTSSTFSSETYIYGTLTVPQGCKSAYQSAEPWKNFWNIVEVGTQSGIDDIVSNKVSIHVDGTTISIQDADNQRIDIYSLSGAKVYSGYDNVIDLGAKGLYIIRIGNHSQKLIL